MTAFGWRATLRGLLLVLVLIAGAALVIQAQNVTQRAIANTLNAGKASHALDAKVAASQLAAAHSGAVAFEKFAAAVEAWQFPNGGDLAPSRIVVRPDGVREAFPARCIVFEDGSARCGEWDEVSK